ncbi:MAG: Dihydrolipoyllysine-residue succinyltransferase component of 2-oxoglutarate dehydrogenase complex [Chlamydiae bacterium]|nr:Dihydrolipoyllysine-residue succinyltransferase component of 2-oxoglutarate dehydrogenase complex [Chlamydiota bacterium]
MSIEIKIPSLGESITEATVGTILVANGSQVKMDQEILEIETEKVNQVLFSPENGELKLDIKEGDVVKIGQVIGSVDPSKATTTEEAKPEVSEKKEEVKTPESQPVENKPPESAPPKETADPKQEQESSSLLDEVRRKPESFVEELRSPISKKETPKIEKKASESRSEERKRMSKIRQTIARRLVDAKQTMAMLTTFNEVDMSAILEMRKKHKDAFLKEHEVKLGFMSFFVKAVSSALKAYPAVNAYIDGADIVYRHYVDINVAMSTERGLVVPVLADCDQMSFAQIEQAIVNLSTKARDNKLSMDEMRAGGFTITNGGIFGSSFSTPIVNPPQSAILGMHKISERPCAINGQVVIRPMMVLALSYDHRIVDGKDGVSFLAHIARLIEDPACLLIDL